jgi:hypothetical protein
MRRTVLLNQTQAPTRRVLLTTFCVAFLHVATGCPTGDPDFGTGTDTEGAAPPELPGVRVECCYELFSSPPGGPTEVALGCAVQQPCIDPDSPVVDTNSDGMLSPSELQDVCARKCPDPLDYPFSGVGFTDPESGGPIAIGPPYDGCIAISGEVQTMAMSCDPSSPAELEPWPQGSIPPTHTGSFSSSAPQSRATIRVNGVARDVGYDGRIALAISDCVTLTPKGGAVASDPMVRRTQCRLELQSLQLELVGSPRFGEYRVDGAMLDLVAGTPTPIDFVCKTRGCRGRFSFSHQGASSVAVNLNWDQTNLSTGSIGGGGIALGAERLGEVSQLEGVIDLDPQMETGTIRVRGTGRDSLGGDFASTSFDMTGHVARSLFAP